MNTKLELELATAIMHNWLRRNMCIYCGCSNNHTDGCITQKAKLVVGEVFDLQDDAISLVNDNTRDDIRVWDIDINETPDAVKYIQEFIR